MGIPSGYTSAQVVQAVPVITTSGLVCVKAETTFSAATSVTADSVFTSTYRNYLVQLQAVTSAGDLLIKFRAGGTATSTGYNKQELLATGSSSQFTKATNQTSLNIGGTGGTFYNLFDIIVYAPQITQPTVLAITAVKPVSDYADMFVGFYDCVQTSSTAFDGIEFSTAVGTITGTYQIYGYSKTV